MLLATLLLTGCATPGPASPDTFCAIAEPIVLDPADRLTASTLRQVIAHDEKGRKVCGWKPPS